VSFEPSGQNLSLLAKNVRMSSLRNVELRSELVLDRVGSATFHDFRGRSWGRSMMGGIIEQDFTIPREVRCITIDSLDLMPDVIKIDVEGAEAAVLDGAWSTIRRSLPVMFIEVHAERLRSLGRSQGGLFAAIRAIGYTVSVVAGGDGAMTQDRFAGNEHPAAWLCRPGDRP
jgi:FkbM family methyltransferase